MYPGGMLMPGRKYAATGKYRYGFNGKENDNEVKGEGNQQDYGMRIYDNRLVKFLSVDPIAKDYPELTPYQFASNTPIQAKDLDGLEADFVSVTINFFSWLFSSDVDKMSSGQNDIYTGVQKMSDGPQRGAEYNEISNDPNSDYSVGEYNAIRKADGMTQALGGVGQIADATYSVAGKIEAGLSLGSAVGNGLARLSTKISGKTLLSKPIVVQPSPLLKPLPISNEIKLIQENLAKPIIVSKPVVPKFGGKTIIIDENLSPTITSKLKDAGYSVKTFEKGTSDADIINWAKNNNAAVLTNNIKDFKGKGIMTLEVPSILTPRNQAQTVVNRIRVIDRNIESHGTGVYNSNSNVNLVKDASLQH